MPIADGCGSFITMLLRRLLFLVLTSSFTTSDIIVFAMSSLTISFISKTNRWWIARSSGDRSRSGEIKTVLQS